MLSGLTTDAVEASALGYKMHHIQVYSNSWGPFDNGFLVEGPGPLLKAVLENGVKKVQLLISKLMKANLSNFSEVNATTTFADSFCSPFSVQCNTRNDLACIYGIQAHMK